MAEPTPTPARGRPFGIRVSWAPLMLIPVALWLGWLANGARSRRAAVRWIEDRGGLVAYRHQRTAAGQFDRSEEPPGPRWLRRWIGDD